MPLSDEQLSLESMAGGPPRPSTTPCIGIGTELADGRYQIDKKLGEGGFGVVYRALEKGGSVRRWVAVKVAHRDRFGGDETARERAYKRFCAEAHLIGQLQHPNVIGIYFDGVHQGQHYFVMEYLEGSQSLATILKAAKTAGTPISLATAKAYFLAAGAGLRAIHRLDGVFHRDIKLENILACETADGPVVKIVDFGIAHNPNLTLTQTGSLMGTPGHQPPESVLSDPATGKLVTLDHRADLFALGVALYRFVTLRQPFETPQEALARDTKPVAPSQLRPMSEAFEAIILRLLEKDRDARYQTCDELLVDLERCNPELSGSSASPLCLTGDLPSIQVSRIDMVADDAALGMAAPPMGIEAVEEAALAPELAGAAAAYAEALQGGRKPSRRRLSKRDIGILAGVAIAMAAMTLSLVLKSHRTQPAQSSLPVRGTVEVPHAAISASDILRDARETKSEFVAQPPKPVSAPAPPPAAVQPQIARVGRGAVLRPKLRRAAPAPAGGTRPERGPTLAAAPAASPPTTAAGMESLEGGPNVLARYESSIPEMSLDTPPGAGRGDKHLGIPTATTATAVLSSPVSSTRPGTLVVANLIYGIVVNGQRAVPAGAKLIGKATFQERAGQWVVDIRFDRLVLPNEAREYRVAVIATQAGEAGLRGAVTKTDQRNEASTGASLLGAVKKAIRDEPGADLADPFLQDRAEDLRELRRSSVVVQLPRNHVFQAQFTQAS